MKNKKILCLMITAALAFTSAIVPNSYEAVSVSANNPTSSSSNALPDADDTYETWMKDWAIKAYGFADGTAQSNYFKTLRSYWYICKGDENMLWEYGVRQPTITYGAEFISMYSPVIQIWLNNYQMDGLAEQFKEIGYTSLMYPVL